MPVTVTTDKTVYQAGEDMVVTVSADGVAPIEQTAEVVAFRTVNGVREEAVAEITIQFAQDVSPVQVLSRLSWRATDEQFALNPDPQVPGRWTGKVQGRL